jgi:CubicO group peptidase (beta-lactamase class C family)
LRNPHPGEVFTLTTEHFVDGYIAPGFHGVREAFVNNFVEHNEIGAACTVSVRGEVVVDLWGGFASLDHTRTWSPDTLVNAFSVGKGITALVAAILVDQGQLSYDTLVSDVWPEFAEHGKGQLLFEGLLGHRAGLPTFRETLPALSMYDWSFMCSALAQEKPWWEPGTAHGYHVNTYGFLVGEVIRRATNKTVGEHISSMLRNPLNADMYLGIPDSEHQRIAEFEWPSNALPTIDTAGFDDEQLLAYNTYNNPVGTSGGGTVNTSHWRRAEIPSTNLHSSSRGIERVYRELTRSGGSLLSPHGLSQSLVEMSNGPDVVLGRNSRFARGFQIPLPERGFGPHPESFGHFGAGGSVGFSDPRSGVAFGYVMNQMGPRWQNPRNRALIDAVYSSLS